MLYPVYFESRSVVVKSTREAVLPDAKFRKWATSQRFEKIGRFSPLRLHDIVEFRDDSILDV